MSGGFVSEIQINEYIVSEIDRKSHAFYRMEIKTSSQRPCYFVDKRFKEFEALHNELKKQVTNTSGFVEFPAKHIYTANHKTFELRRSMLDTYINKLISYYGDGDYPVELIKFLKLDEQDEHEFENVARDDQEQQEQPLPSLSPLGVKELTFEEVAQFYSRI